MHLYSCRDVEGYRAINDSAEFRRRYELQVWLAERNQHAEHFDLPGWCHVCSRPTMFRVDWQSTFERHGKLRIPNWRERLVCASCGLNNRMRSMLQLALEAVQRARLRRTEVAVYLTEQVTATFAQLQQLLARGATMVGSEYLADADAATRRNLERRGVRHQDLQQLTLPDAAFDVVLTNDVLEHVPDPRAAIRELARVMRPGAQLLLSVPIDLMAAHSVQRARLRAGGDVEHLHPAAFHQNPLDPRGSLVFWDYGWDLLDWLGAAGFEDPHCLLYWSMEYGYLGGPLPVIRAERPRP